MSGVKWAESEIIFLKENYRTMNNDEIAEKLGRSANAVKLKAQKVGIQKDNKWTEDDDIYLSYFVWNGDEKIRVASEFLNRSYGATKHRISYLRKQDPDNVPRMMKKWTKEEVDFLKTHYSHMTCKSIAERLGRSFAAVEAEVATLGLKKLKLLKTYDDEIRKLAEEGYYLSEIASIIGVRQHSLYDYMWRKNIDYKRKKDNSNHPWRKDADAMFAINKQHEDVRE